MQSTVVVDDNIDNCFSSFKSDVSYIALPEKFTFPFYYTPHLLSKIAAEELQEHLSTQTEWKHNFGLDPSDKSLEIGKMFGVLVVKSTNGKLGYLSAFSGKMAGGNHHLKFVPPVFDMLKEGSFYSVGENEINKLNRKIEKLEADEKFIAASRALKSLNQEVERKKSEGRSTLNETKRARKKRRLEGKESLSETEFQELCEVLKYESLKGQYLFKKKCEAWDEDIDTATKNLAVYLDTLTKVKTHRKQKSNKLQNKLFDQYAFLNSLGETKNLKEIFGCSDSLKPPAGAGECAAPKLLHYAFKNNYSPVCMAEFWWGASLKDEIRKHKYYYPACRGKCEPILGHMLEGMTVDDNPMLSNPAIGKTISTIFEDEHIVLINKPAEFLSVPGKQIKDSVQSRMEARYPDATGPLLVHRLDMSTSGLMIIAKSKEVHKAIQKQFIQRTVTKRYVALLDGDIEGEDGVVELPIRVDLNDRPRQLVCYEHGKSAKTIWKVVNKSKGKTRVYFYPITGRTHQLRVHAAHSLGLNTPIVGDDLYGKKGDRLHLHTDYLKFIHPVSKKVLNFKCKPNF